MKKLGKVLEEKERELLAKSEVSLILNSYDDIYSGFDPRPFSSRALSVDFLDEAKRATRDIGLEKFELRFLISAAKKNLEKEAMIKKRLKEHFKKHASWHERDHWKIIKQGIYFIIFGLIFMFVAAYILFYYYNQVNFLKEFLVVLLEPGGWFLFWEGLDLLIFETKRLRPDLTFYRKMTRVEIVFSHY